MLSACCPKEGNIFFFVEVEQKLHAHALVCKTLGAVRSTVEQLEFRLRFQRASENKKGDSLFLVSCHWLT